MQMSYNKNLKMENFKLKFKILKYWQRIFVILNIFCQIIWLFFQALVINSYTVLFNL